MRQNLKTLNMTKLKITKCDKTNKLKCDKQNKKTNCEEETKIH